MRILLAEDNRKLAVSICTLLEKENYLSDWAPDGIIAWELISKNDYECIILDWMMPGMDGIELLKMMRNTGTHTPVLVLSARSEVEDRITGLESGADDYLSKPFAFAELLARLRALTRRPPALLDNILTMGNTSLDRITGRLFCNESSVSVHGKEFLLLESFFTHPGRILSSDQLISRLWKVQEEGSPASLAVHLSNVRKKLRLVHSDLVLHSIRREGYLLECSAAKKPAAVNCGENHD